MCSCYAKVTLFVCSFVTLSCPNYSSDHNEICIYAVKGTKKVHRYIRFIHHHHHLIIARMKPQGTVMPS